MIGFALLTVAAIYFKESGHTILWGWQFQNPTLMITIIFMLLMMLLTASHFINIKQAITKLFKSEKLIFVLFGGLTVAMAISCPMGYLEELMVSAEMKNRIEFGTVMMIMAAGVAFPYLLLGLCPWLIVLIPTPGKWMNGIKNLAIFMILLAIILLFTIIWAQYGKWFAIRLLFYGLLILGIIWADAVTAEIDYSDFTPQKAKKAGFILKAFFGSLFFAVYIIAMLDGYFSYSRFEKNVDEQYKLTDGYINLQLQDGKTILVALGNNYCLQCRYNEATVFNLPSFVDKTGLSNIEFVKIDASQYTPEILDFMTKYQKYSLPLYVLFSPLAPEGIVLPSILESKDLSELIKNFTLMPKTL